MKTVTSLLCSLILLIALTPSVSATEVESFSDTSVYYNVDVLENGITVINEITAQPLTRTTQRSATRTSTFKDGDTVIAVIAIQATFRYDGSTVSVVSKSVTQADTYSGWSYSQKSFTSSGGTVTLEGTLNFLWILNSSSFTMTLSCDKNGNIT